MPLRQLTLPPGQTTLAPRKLCGKASEGRFKEFLADVAAERGRSEVIVRRECRGLYDRMRSSYSWPELPEAPETLPEEVWDNVEFYFKIQSDVVREMREAVGADLKKRMSAHLLHLRDACKSCARAVQRDLDQRNPWNSQGVTYARGAGDVACRRHHAPAKDIVAAECEFRRARMRDALVAAVTRIQLALESDRLEAARSRSREVLREDAAETSASAEAEARSRIRLAEAQFCPDCLECDFVWGGLCEAHAARAKAFSCA